MIQSRLASPWYPVWPKVPALPTVDREQEEPELLCRRIVGSRRLPDLWDGAE